MSVFDAIAAAQDALVALEVELVDRVPDEEEYDALGGLYWHWHWETQPIVQQAFGRHVEKQTWSGAGVHQ